MAETVKVTTIDITPTINAYTPEMQVLKRFIERLYNENQDLTNEEFGKRIRFMLKANQTGLMSAMSIILSRDILLKIGVPTSTIMKR